MLYTIQKYIYIYIIYIHTMLYMYISPTKLQQKSLTYRMLPLHQVALSNLHHLTLSYRASRWTKIRIQNTWPEAGTQGWGDTSWQEMDGITLQGINISHLGKRKIIFKMDFSGDMLVSRRVSHDASQSFLGILSPICVFFVVFGLDRLELLYFFFWSKWMQMTWGRKILHSDVGAS